MDGIDRTAKAAADAARVHEADEPRQKQAAGRADAQAPAQGGAQARTRAAAQASVQPGAQASAPAPTDAEERLAAQRARQLADASAQQGSVPDDHPTPSRKRQIYAIFAGLLLAMFVSSLSETVTATALPTIVGDLGGVDHMQWVTTAYILAATVMMPIYGKLGDLFGRKYLLVIALSVFIVGSAVCGFATSMELLILGRAVEGLGGGGLIILSQATIADVIPPRQRGKYMGVIGSVFALATVVGPLLGGWFVPVTGWRWLFAFNVPLALLAIAAVMFFLTKPVRRENRPPIDVGGMMSMAISVGSLVLATAWGGTLYAWDSFQIIGLFVLCIVAALVFVQVERRAKEPIIPLLLFKNKNFVLCTTTGLIIMLGMMGTMSYLPTYFQIVDQRSPEQAGLMTVPMMAGVRITAIGTGFLATKTGRYKWMPIACCLVMAVAFLLLSRMAVGTPLLVTGVFLFVLGFGIGLGQQILVLVVQNEFPHRIVGTATAANNFFRQIGSTLGASLVGALFTSRLSADLLARLPKVDNINMNDITPNFVQHLEEPARSIITSSYSDALVPLFLYIVPLLLVGAVIMALLKENPLATNVNHTGHPSDDDL